jgi:hypothetical protein
MMKGTEHFDVEIDRNNIIHTRIGGDLHHDTMPAFMAWAHTLRTTVRDVYNRKGGKVRAIIDISGLTSYDTEILAALAQLMKNNEPYILKSATFGGNAYIVLAQDILLALSGRTNLKAFKTEAAA